LRQEAHVAITTFRGQILYLGHGKQEGYVSPGKNGFWVHDSLKIRGDGGEKTIGPISILSTAEPEIQPGATGSFIIAASNKLNILVGIVKDGAVYNYSRRAAEDSRKGKILGWGFIIVGILLIPFLFIGFFFIARGIPFVNFPSVSTMKDTELMALV
jgi:hypothetical protein